jgi:hypothetical protein
LFYSEVIEMILFLYYLCGRKQSNVNAYQ